ncbi:hypothetical protein DOLIC_00106 [Dolichomitus sp. PSUC_FEM 10030005]|nr:hypothetical protein [Dolichomitus sp. PSUC_FEM 10030005]
MDITIGNTQYIVGVKEGVQQYRSIRGGGRHTEWCGSYGGEQMVRSARAMLQ